MGIEAERVRKEISRALTGVGVKELLSVRRYVRLVRARGPIDLDQVYFWTRKWQGYEREADRTKRERRILGDGTARELIATLRS